MDYSKVAPLLRVFEMSDGHLKFAKFFLCCKGPNETDLEFMDRTTAKLPYGDMPYRDIPLDQKPKDKTDRDLWRWNKNKDKIEIDKTLESRATVLKDLEDKLDKEFDKEKPVSVTLIKLQRQKDKICKESWLCRKKQLL